MACVTYATTALARNIPMAALGTTLIHVKPSHAMMGPLSQTAQPAVAMQAATPTPMATFGMRIFQPAKPIPATTVQ
jgi:hypothetical protein